MPSNGHGKFAHKDKGEKAKFVDKAKASREWQKAERRLAAKRAGNVSKNDLNTL